jgi:hypothetical protein
MAKASLIECQNHLVDAVDRGLIPDSLREEHDRLAQMALREIGGLLDYLQSPEAQRNAERVRRLRFDRRAARTEKAPGTTGVAAEPDPGTRTCNTEPRTLNKNRNRNTNR